MRRRIRVELIVDEDTILSVSGTDSFGDAVNSELGWLHDSGMFVEDWEEINEEKEERK